MNKKHKAVNEGIVPASNYTYTVSDVANILGMTPSALFFFEGKNLINIKRNARGHRVYQVKDIFRLISYAKYRSMGFSTKTISQQYNDASSNWQRIFQRLQKYREEASHKAEHYNRLVDAIDQHIVSVNRINNLLDTYEFVQSPAVKFCYDDECGWISKNRQAQTHVHKWVEAQPIVRLGIMLHSETPPRASFGYTVFPELYEKLALPPNLNLQDFPPMSCIHTIVTIGEELMSYPHKAFEKPLKYTHSRGFKLAGNPWAHILLVEHLEETQTRGFLELWVPIT